MTHEQQHMHKICRKMQLPQPCAWDFNNDIIHFSACQRGVGMITLRTVDSMYTRVCLDDNKNRNKREESAFGCCGDIRF